MHQDDRSLGREKRLLVLLGFVSLALVGGALYLQFFQGEDPCPLCIIQRYFFVLIAVFAFLGAGMRGWRGVALLELLVVISALGGVATALRHVYVQSHPGFSCGFDALQPIVDNLPPARWLPQVFKVAGLCETPYPPILGISLPQWSLIAFGVIFLLVGGSLRLKRKLRAAAR
ncbi:disulfide bond formation protein B [Caballeronia sp. LP006]|jgi:disulfide bond formation protein DsbB|uniref:disulfide bond formation protein B n=1 Tax=unclassified Caballeronia TaxID=2646786 RepID=UPI001FD51DBA|nr:MULTISPECIES: disulfide bond formation protein B [unclassified Caballeronia]MDR5770929.1 disulfide bond formation protein B [Caballeronia sp. LZ002]MDR5802689.1 disulfide bond formation protein B [Caballeronia sp. LZ001]MDR5830659.1 disulfide bond formation protein B [Caballeronia sp. LP006]MDR5846366.1 disulfide bond formation protein B [Caballeronia sp. LZ003]